jgi:16S rRNA (guanine966-N2)-methyltransferase
VFNMLGNLEGTRVLDLFAGSGALGIEALSRGSTHATFVERDPRAIGVIRANLEALGYEGRYSVVRADVGRWLEARSEEATAAQVILVDPPYNDAVLDRALELLGRSLDEAAVVVVEHAFREPLSTPARLRTLRQRRYGDTAVTLLEAGPR